MQAADGASALMIVSVNGYIKTVEFLLANNDAKVNMQATDGTSALMMASQYGHTKIVDLLS